jgi:hypothetical protein
VLGLMLLFIVGAVADVRLVLAILGLNTLDHVVVVGVGGCCC